MLASTRDTLLRVALPTSGIVIMLTVARIRHISYSNDLGLRLPRLTKALPWLLGFLILSIVEETLWMALGLPQPTRWVNKYDMITKLVRIMAMVIMAPIAEELLFRGLLFYMFRKTSLKETGAIMLTAGLFAIVHIQYEFSFMLIVLIHGLLYGAARYSTGSTLFTILLHALGNGYAAYQRF